MSVGHFGSVVGARLVRADTGATEATAETGGAGEWGDLARSTCRALVAR